MHANQAPHSRPPRLLSPMQVASILSKATDFETDNINIPVRAFNWKGMPYTQLDEGFNPDENFVFGLGTTMSFPMVESGQPVPNINKTDVQKANSDLAPNKADGSKRHLLQRSSSNRELGSKIDSKPQLLPKTNSSKQLGIKTISKPTMELKKTNSNRQLNNTADDSKRHFIKKTDSARALVKTHAKREVLSLEKANSKRQLIKKTDSKRALVIKTNSNREVASLEKANSKQQLIKKALSTSDLNKATTLVSPTSSRRLLMTAKPESKRCLQTKTNSKRHLKKQASNKEQDAVQQDQDKSQVNLNNKSATEQQQAEEKTSFCETPVGYFREADDATSTDTLAMLSSKNFSLIESQGNRYLVVVHRV